MRLVAIEELKENDVVLVNRPRLSSGGGLIDRYYIGCVAHSLSSSSSDYVKEVVLWTSWDERFGRPNRLSPIARHATSLCHFGKDEPDAVAQLIGRWNPNTRQVESV